MIKLKDGEIKQILPENLAKQSEVIAASYAIGQAVKKAIKYSELTGVYAAIDELPEIMLDLLAIESRTQYYDEELPIEIKRNIIKRTLLWYYKAGTPSAVEELVSTVFGEGKIEEWFEYGDEPYYFKITTGVQMTPEINALFSAMLKRVKNARSHIRKIEIFGAIKQTIYPAINFFSAYRLPAIRDGYQEKRKITGEAYVGLAKKEQVFPMAIIDGFSGQGKEIQMVACVGTATVSNYYKNETIQSDRRE